jgi:hypothetical protein
VRIECAVCTGVILCIECFASGSEAPELGHTRGHAYKCVVVVCGGRSWRCSPRGRPAGAHPLRPAALPSRATAFSRRVHENRQSFCLFDRDWSAEDELNLLQGIDMYGMGNWR